MSDEPIAQRSVSAWIDDLAARRPTPGGGGAAALAGSIGAAVGAMAAAYTTGRRWADRSDRAEALASRLRRAATELLVLADADATAYAALQASWKHDDLDPAERQRIEAEARAIPRQLIALVTAEAEALAGFAADCNPRIVSDLHCGIILLAAAGRAAMQTLLVNEPPADELAAARSDLERLAAWEARL